MEENKYYKNYQHHGPTGAVIIFFILLFIYAKFGPSIPFSILSQQRGEPLIVDGTGKVSVAPDIAKVSIGIEQSGNSLKTVQEAVNVKSKKLTDALEGLGIDKKDIKTTGYNVYPEYDYQNPGSRITGYRVSTNYEVKVVDFDKVNDVLVLATNEGANVVGGISFELNDKTEKEKLQEAREIAVKEAKEKAEGLAKASNLSLGKVINITESFGAPALMRQYAELSVSSDVALKEITNPAEIQPGQTELSVTVALSYEIR